MYLENKSSLEMEMSQTGAQGHQKSEAVAGNFDELRLLEGFSKRTETQKLLQAATVPPGHHIIYTEHQEHRYGQRLGCQYFREHARERGTANR